MDSRSKEVEPAKTETVQKKSSFTITHWSKMGLFGLEGVGYMTVRDDFDYSASTKPNKPAEEIWALDEKASALKK